MTKISLRGLLATAVLLLASGESFGFGKNKVVYKNFDWHVYTSPHFEVHYYPEEEEFLQAVVSDAESAYVKLSKFLDHEIKYRIPLIYYRTHGDFEQTNVDLAEIPQGVGAFAEPFQNRIVIPIDEPPDRFAAVLRHELTHIFEFSIFYGESLRRTIRSSPPLWIMEGLASYLGEDETNIDRMVIRDAVVNNYIPPLRLMDPAYVDGFLVYRFGHAIFDFIESEHGREGVRSFLFEYRKVLLTNNIEKALKEAFGLDYDEFDLRFTKYLRHKYFPVLMEKNEPLDYGREIGIKKPGRYTFSPTLSPSGELIAALATPHEKLDVVILSSNDGKVVRNLTKGFTTEYEDIITGAFDGRRDLTWSPEGDRVAFFVRKENRRPLLIYDALKGKRLETIETGIDNCYSPAFSPDGTKIAFSGNKMGIVDIFVLDLATRTITNATDDPYFDTNPSWSADGKTLLYNRRVGLSEKIFLVETADHDRKTQLTFETSNDLMPTYSHDPSIILFASDRRAGIYNIAQLDTRTGEIAILTDMVGSAFGPVQLPDKDGKPQLAYVGYTGGTFRLFRMEIKPPVETAKAEEPSASPETLVYRPELNLSLDEAEKKKYKRKWSVDAPTITLGAASDGTIFTDSHLVFSDLLGDYRYFITLSSVSTFANFDLTFLDLKQRLQRGFEVFDYRDYFVATLDGQNQQERQESHQTGGFVFAQYPFSRYYRVQGQLGYIQRSQTVPFADFNTGLVDFETFRDSYVIGGLSWSGDTTRFRSFGPYHGKRFNLSVTRGQQISGDTGSYTNYLLDFRAYAHMTRRSLLAWRFFALASEGEGASIGSIGGYNDLRGYDFREIFGNRVSFTNLELRYPLVDELRFPFGSIRDMRGTIFLDIGTAYFTPDGFQTTGNVPTGGNVFFSKNLQTFRSFGPCDFFGNCSGEVVPFKVWDSENDRFQDVRASWGLGFAFLFGGLELHWDFAHQLPYTDFEQFCVFSDGTSQRCPSGPLVGTIETRLQKFEVNEGGVRTNFWIGFSF